MEGYKGKTFYYRKVSRQGIMADFGIKYMTDQCVRSTDFYQTDINVHRLVGERVNAIGMNGLGYTVQGLNVQAGVS